MIGIDLEKERKRLKKEVSTKVAGYLTAALGLVAGLAWNEAIAELIDTLFPQTQGTLLAKFLYAIILTLAVVVVTVYILRFLQRKEG